jgi:hypothetical protein
MNSHQHVTVAENGHAHVAVLEDLRGAVAGLHHGLHLDGT